MVGRVVSLVVSAFLVACDGGSDPAEQSLEQTPSSQCPAVSMDGLDGKWLKYSGAAVKAFRFQVADVGGEKELWYTGGGFTKRRMAGERRSNDYVFTEVPGKEKLARYKAGAVPLVRLYVEPRPQDCSLRVSEMEVLFSGDKEQEKPKGTYTTYVAYPDSGPDLSFRHCDQELFIGPAASDKAVADQQLVENGTAAPSAALGEGLALGAWSPVMGEEGCTYDMKLYFDDEPARDAAGAFRDPVPVTGESWLVSDWYAPYSGNHHFQIAQRKTCGGSTEVIGMACLEAILQ